MSEPVLAERFVEDTGDAEVVVRAFVSDAETLRATETALAELGLGKTVVEQGNIRTAVERLGVERSPKLLLVDLCGSELPLSDIDQLAEVCEPGVAVVALGDRDEVALYRELLNHGVADYLLKPVTSGLLVSALQRVAEGDRPQQRMSRLGTAVGVLGVRGGVGATTIACGLAYVIAERRRRRVALLDLDPVFGSVALTLDLDPTTGLRDALEDGSRVDALVIERLASSHSETLSVLAAETPLADPVHIDPVAVGELLLTLRNRFHYVITDMPRTLGEHLLGLIERTDILLLVADLSLASMRDTLRVLQLLPRINASCRPVVVINRAGWAKGSELERSEFERGIGREIDVVVPFDGATVPAAVNSGRLDYAQRGAVAAALDALAGKVSGRPAAARESWLRRLFSRGR